MNDKLLEHGAYTLMNDYGVLGIFVVIFLVGIASIGWMLLKANKSQLKDKDEHIKLLYEEIKGMRAEYKTEVLDLLSESKVAIGNSIKCIEANTRVNDELTKTLIQLSGKQLNKGL